VSAETALARARAPVTLALVVAVVVNIAWGSTPVATRLAVEDVPPLMVAVLRTVIAGLVAAPILLAMRTRAPEARRSRGLLVLSALTGFVLFPILYTLGQQRTSATHGALILAALVLDERLTPELALPAAAVLAGVWIAQRR